MKNSKRLSVTWGYAWDKSFSEGARLIGINIYLYLGQTSSELLYFIENNKLNNWEVENKKLRGEVNEKIDALIYKITDKYKEAINSPKMTQKLKLDLQYLLEAEKLC